MLRVTGKSQRLFSPLFLLSSYVFAIDQSPATIFKWRPGEPNGGDHEDCLMFQFTKEGRELVGVGMGAEMNHPEDPAHCKNFLCTAYTYREISTAFGFC